MTLLLLWNFDNFIMIKCSPKVSRTEDLSSDLASSQRTDTTRKSFKRIERTNSRKSNRSDSCESNDSLSIKSFYVKNVMPHRFTRGAIDASPLDDINPKKRAPTPCKSRRELTNQPEAKDNSPLKLKIIQNSIRIQQLEENIKRCSKREQQLGNKIKQYQQKNSSLELSCLSSSQKVEALTRQNLSARKKIADLEKNILESESNLKTVNSSLDHLRKAIKENQVNDAKKENAMLSEQNKKLKKQLEELSSQLADKDKIIDSIQKQNERMKSRMEIEAKCKNESMREKFLEREIQSLRLQLGAQKGLEDTLNRENLIKLESEKHRLENDNKKLRIELDYIHRQHMEEFKLFSRKKNEELQLAQARCLRYKKEIHQLRRDLRQRYENESGSKVLGLNSKLSNQKSNISVREGPLECERKRKHSLSFELSPQ